MKLVVVKKYIFIDSIFVFNLLKMQPYSLKL